MFSTNFTSIIDLITTFSTQEKCIKYLEQIRWNNEPVSPFDSSSKVYKCQNGRYKCKNTGKYFNVMTGTMFEGTKIELQKWFLAIWLITSHKKGISSTQLAKDINVTQKTSWFLLQRIRACFEIENYNDLEGVVESDESWVGGKNRNRHKDKKVKNSQGRSFKDKTPVLGMIQRGGKITAIVVKNTASQTLQPLVRKYIKDNSVLITDDWKGYNGLNRNYTHYSIKHSSTGYKHNFGREVHTNSVEGSWKIMKNSLRDMYNHVSKKHLQYYVDEFVYRYNTRDLIESDRFNWLILNSNVRTTYKKLIA